MFISTPTMINWLYFEPQYYIKIHSFSINTLSWQEKNIFYPKLSYDINYYNITNQKNNAMKTDFFSQTVH